MADQLDSNTRSPNPDAEIDDPLAELARIIGYERPAEVAHVADEALESNEFDLEAELMRELDVPLAPSDDDLDGIEADVALDELLAAADFDLEHEQENDDQAFADDARLENVGSDMPELDDAGVFSADGRSSGDLLKAIENDFPVDVEELASELDATSAEPDVVDEQQIFEPVKDNVAPSMVAEPGTAQTSATTGHLDDDILADMVRFDLPASTPEMAESVAVLASSQSVEPHEGIKFSDQSSPSDDDQNATLDFEEYLSTELDVFGHEVAMNAVQPDIQEAEQAEAVDVADDELADADPDFNVEAALDSLNDSTLDDDVAVFDDAAEDLLAGLNGGVDFSKGPDVSAGPSMETADDWSLDNIEESATDELDGELGDMFGLPERVVDPSSKISDETDDFELDLEQVLADSFDDSDDDRAEPVGMAITDSGAEEVATADDWLSDEAALPQSAERDEMADAFLGLVPGGYGEATNQVPASELPVETLAPKDPGSEPHQDDWLAGFETSEHAELPAESKPDLDEYYFDADLISEADEAVETVGEIDVPELAHDEPQPFDPDYETEIEREFATIGERHENNADDEAADVAAAGLGTVESWSRNAGSSRGYEVSDDYIALERELGFGEGHSTGAFAADVSGEDYLAGEADFRHEAENRSRGPIVAVAVLALAVIAGVGAFGWSMFSGDGTTADGGPRIIRADTEPVKVLPENPGGVTVPNQDKAVYDRVAGGSGSSTGQPALVNSAEEPIDVVQRTLDPEILPLEGRNDATGKSEDRLAAGENTPEAFANGATAPVVAPRKVRTMIVKPDGSIVAREEPVAVPSATGEQPQTLASAASQIVSPVEPASGSEAVEQPVSEAAVTPVENALDTEVSSSDGTLAPVRVVKTQPIRPVSNAPVPQGRPADQPVNVIGTVSQGGRVGAAPAASAVPATPAAPQPVAVASAPAAAAPAANPGGYYVQIASQPTAEGAQSSWNTLSNRYSSVLGGLSVDIQRADIVGKGVFHRVKVPAGSKDQANALCSRYKAAGGSCFVSR